MTTRPIVTVKSLKYDNSVQRTWSASLIENSGDMLVLEGVFDRDIVHSDLGHIEAGTVSIEYFWLNRWYSIFQFLGPNRQLRNYYCNVNMPPVFSRSTLSFVDLDLDVVVWPDNRYSVLDEAEFEENALSFAYPQHVRERAIIALDELIALIESGSLPKHHA